MLYQVDALRLRLEEKETMLNKKTKQIQDMAEEKGTQAGEIHDLKDMLDVKERKVNVLQKKVRCRCCEPRAPHQTHVLAPATELCLSAVRASLSFLCLYFCRS